LPTAVACNPMSRPELKQMPTDGKPSVLAIRGSLLARNTVLNFLGLALPLIIGVVTIPFIIRWLGVDRFGILSLAWVVVGYFGFLDLGLGRATTKFVAEALGKGDIGKIPDYFWTTVYVQALMGVFGAVILWILTPLLVDRVLNVPPALMGETRTTFFVLAFSLPVVLISASFRGILEAGQRFDLVNMVKIPSSTVNYALPVFGILAGLGLPGIMVLLVVSRGLTLIAWIWLTLRVFPVLRARLRPDRSVLKPLMSFGGWVTVSNVVSPVLVYLDRFLIGSLITMEAVGFYSAPYEFVMRLGIIPSSLLMTLFPMFSALEGGADRRKSKLLFGRSVKYLLIVMGLIVVILVLTARFFIGTWLGDEFLHRSLRVFQILSLGFLANALANVPYGFLQGIGRADVTAKFHLIELAFYIPLTWLLVRTWGITGAAVSWTIRTTSDMVLLFWASGRIGGIRFSALRESGVLWSGALLAAFALFGHFVMKPKWGAYGLAGMTALLLFAFWRCSFSAEERTWILGKLRWLIGKKAESEPGRA